MTSLIRSRISLLVLGQFLLCWLEAYLISKISLIGRIGIATIHPEYRLLRSGWKTFLLLFCIQLAIILLLHLIQKRFPDKPMTVTTYLLLGFAGLGLLLTFQDFLHTYTHRLLKERFHLGFYLFWMGWMGNCIFFLLAADTKKKEPHGAAPSDPSGLSDSGTQTPRTTN